MHDFTPYKEGVNYALNVEFFKWVRVTGGITAMRLWDCGNLAG